MGSNKRPNESDSTAEAKRLKPDDPADGSKLDFEQFMKGREKEDKEVFDAKRCKIEKEIDAFNLGGELSSSLKFVKESLEKIRPTSVECERLFSLVGLFVTRLRSSLNDDTLNVLIILKSYFKELEEKKRLEGKGKKPASG